MKSLNQPVYYRPNQLLMKCLLVRDYRAEQPSFNAVKIKYQRWSKKYNNHITRDRVIPGPWLVDTATVQKEIQQKLRERNRKYLDAIAAVGEEPREISEYLNKRGCYTNHALVERQLRYLEREGVLT